MAYWVRKVTRSKWPEEVLPVESMPADVISSELRTQKNTLSFWRIETLDELEKAALALSVSSKSTSIETIDMVYISEEEITNSQIAVECSPGDTVIPDLAGLHRDLCALNYRTLGVVSSIINHNMKQNHAKRFTKKQVKEFLKKAYAENRVCPDICNANIYNEIAQPAV